MPYICLTQNIPDGTVQITDLLPNVSTRNATTDGPGQNRYVNRVQNDTVSFGGPDYGDAKTPFPYRGLSAYIVDRIVPGGGAFAELRVNLVDPQAGTFITFNYGSGFVDFVFDAAPDPALGTWNDATTLAAALNHANARATFQLGYGTGNWVTGVVDGSDVILRANSKSGAFLTAYPNVSFSVGPGALRITTTPANANQLFLPGGDITDPKGKWTPAQVAGIAAAIIARMDAGQALTESDVNTVLSGVVSDTALGTDLGGGTSSLSDILAILAGREFYLPAGSVLYTNLASTNAKTAIQGTFTRTSVTNGSAMVNGEYRPVTVGGDVVQVERKPVRSTVQSSSLQNSLAAGVLKHFTEGITLFPDSDSVPTIPWTYQSNTALTNLTNRRLVTVYNDDGSLLA
jgi:hypothetical protein